MNLIKKGSFVYKKSFSKDVIYTVDKILKLNNNRVALLRGVTERVMAESPLEDLVLADKLVIRKTLEVLESRIDKRINERLNYNHYLEKLNNNSRFSEKIVTGKILHLDGDKKYSQKSYNYYKKIGLNAIVKNIPEYRQPKFVASLLKLYKPDILIITGHDEMLNKNRNYNDIYNYRNSKYFINTVKEARKFESNLESNLVIFAGACQSFYEGLILAGANFASSPARILIDFLDPLIIAEKVATTERYKYINIDDVAPELRDGKNGIDGIGASGKMYKKMLL